MIVGKKEKKEEKTRERLHPLLRVFLMANETQSFYRVCYSIRPCCWNRSVLELGMDYLR